MKENNNNKIFEVYYTEMGGSVMFAEPISATSYEEAVSFFERRYINKEVLKNPKSTVYLAKGEIIK